MNYFEKICIRKLLVVVFLVVFISPAYVVYGKTKSMEAAMHQLPLYFERNSGQLSDEIEFFGRGKNFKVNFLTNNVHWSFSGHKRALSLQFLDTNSLSIVVGVDQLSGKSHYFHGNNPKLWKTNVGHYAKVRYANLYPRIDVEFYETQGQIEYDFVIEPKGDVSSIKFRFNDDLKPKLDSEGNILFDQFQDNVVLERPYAYQIVRGEEVEVKSQYKISEDGSISFRLGDYDLTKKVVIDPVIAYSTYLGGSQNEQGNGIAIDDQGYIYLTGFTSSSDFPTKSPTQPYGGNTDIFVTKIDISTNQLIFSSYIGGDNYEIARNLRLDDQGNIYVVGNTQSSNFPLVNPFQSSLGGFQDVVVVKLNNDGSQILYSTLLGGATGAKGSLGGIENGFSIDVDASKNIYVTGWTASTDFPLLNPIQAQYGGGSNDMFVTKINSDGASLGYSTYLGGFNHEEGYDIAVNGKGFLHLAGFSASPDFPVMNALQSTINGTKDGVIAKIDPSGSFVFSSFFGGSDEENFEGIDLDSSGNIYVTGWTHSNDYPTLNPIQNQFAGVRDATIAKFDSNGSNLLFSTYLGGSNQEVGIRLDVDDQLQHITVVGEVWSTDFPTFHAVQAQFGGPGADGFVTKLGPNGQYFIYSTYLGGNSFDTARAVVTGKKGATYITGSTSSTDFPLKNPYQPVLLNGDAFITKISLRKSLIPQYRP